ncbi:DUF4326 domain-containing protein (plasmid) [Synechocystis sp. B12]|nr:DUF4326 domain-containing protein [Synechocystis sp. B12]
MLIVLNGKKFGFIGENKIYIGRANGQLPQSPLANPFILGRDGDRLTVVEKFRHWLWPQIKQWQETGELTPLVMALKDLAIASKENRTVILTCWCRPSPCHGDVIDSCVQWLIKENLV